MDGMVVILRQLDDDDDDDDVVVLDVNAGVPSLERHLPVSWYYSSIEPVVLPLVSFEVSIVSC